VARAGNTDIQHGITLNDDSDFPMTQEERLQHLAGFRRFAVERDGITPPIFAPIDQLVLTPTGGLQKPISIRQLSTLYGKPNKMSEFYGLYPGVPDSGAIKLSDFVGAGGILNVKGTLYLDRYDDLVATMGLFPRPDFSWTKNELGHNIGAPKDPPYMPNTYPQGQVAHWRNSMNNSFSFMYWIGADPSKIINVNTYTLNADFNHTRNSGYEPTGAVYRAYVWNNGNVLTRGSLGSNASSGNYYRHLRPLERRFVSNGVVDTTQWINASTTHQEVLMNEVKSHIADGFLCSTVASIQSNKDWAFCNYLSAYIDLDLEL